MEVLRGIWDSLAPARDILIALLAPLVVSAVLHYFRPKVRLTYGTANLSAHGLQDSPTSPMLELTTEKIFIENAGRAPASRLEIVLSSPPLSFSLLKARQNETKLHLDGKLSIFISHLAPKELLQIDLIGRKDQESKVITVHCADAIAKEVAYWPEKVLSAWARNLLILFVFLGFSAIVYVAITLLRSL